jgi:hypothetical protein
MRSALLSAVTLAKAGAQLLGSTINEKLGPGLRRDDNLDCGATRRSAL